MLCFTFNDNEEESFNGQNKLIPFSPINVIQLKKEDKANNLKILEYMNESKSDYPRHWVGEEQMEFLPELKRNIERKNSLMKLLKM